MMSRLVISRPLGLPGTGFGTVVLNTAETQITATVNWANLTSNVSQAQIHGPASVGVPSDRIPFPLFPLSLSDTPKAPTDSAGPIVFSINAEDLAYPKASLLYFNVHTMNFPDGEIRGPTSSTNGATPIRDRSSDAASRRHRSHRSRRAMPPPSLRSAHGAAQ